jgi:hypothetical protein
VKSRIYVISKNNYLQHFPYQHEDLDLGEPPVVVKSWHEMCLSCMLGVGIFGGSVVSPPYNIMMFYCFQ